MLNKYETEPINQNVLTHKFRERERLKEINPDMKFSTFYPKSPQNTISSRLLSPKLKSKYTIFSENTTPRKPKTHIKSTLSLLLKLGVLKKGSGIPLETDVQIYNILANASVEDADHKNSVGNDSDKSIKESPTNKNSAKKGMQKLDFKNPINLVKQLLFRAISNRESYYLPKLAKPSDPIRYAAEKLLLQSDTIRRKPDKFIKYPEKCRRADVNLAMLIRNKK